MQQNDLTNGISPAVTMQTAESLRQALAELERRHELGDSNLCESILAERPDLCQSREAVLELIYLEFVLSQEANHPISAEALQLRFPEYRADLQKILSVDRVFRDQAHTPSPTDSTIGSQLNGSQSARIDRNLQFDQLGDYELLEIIGHGGMGVVYRARQQRLKRFVAVKTIDVLSSLNPVTVARFHDEAELVAKLQHPNIVQVYEVASIQGVPYFSMELVSGGTLAQATQARPLVPVTAAKIVETLARAVHYAHSQSVVHRDLKPANILLSPSDRSQAIEVPVISQPTMLDSQPLSTRCEPKIADFGLAKFLEGARDRTATGAMIGTPSYMAPEQIDPALGAIGPACDIYSLGAILYNAMTGTPPFNAATVIETIQQVRTSEVIPPSRLQAKIPRDLETICLKCLRKDQTKRYQTANDLADDLERFLAGQPIRARSAGLVERNWKWARRHPSLTAFLLAVFVASIGMTLLWLRSEHSRRGEQAALQRNDQLLYDRDIALAQFEYDSNRIASSREILEKTRPEFRGWEWDYLRNQSAASVWESPEQLDPIHRADISSDGRYVAWVSRKTRQDSQSITVWDIAKNQLRWRLESDHPRSFTDVRFSSDGNWLLSSSLTKIQGQPSARSTTTLPGGSVTLWDLRTGTVRRSYSATSTTLSRFSQDGKSIFVSLVQAGGIEQYSIDSGDLVNNYRPREKPADQPGLSISFINHSEDLDFNPDGSLLAVAAVGSGVTLWDTKTGKKLRDVKYRPKHGESTEERRVDWSPDGQWLSVSNYQGSRRLYKVGDEAIRLANEQQYDAFSYGRFTPDGQRFVSVVTGGSIEVRKFPSGELEKTIAAHNGRTHAISFDSTGRYMMTGGADCRVHVWDLSMDDPRYVSSPSTGSLVSDIVFSPAGTQVALALNYHEEGPRLEIRDVDSHELVCKLTGHTKGLTCVAYSVDGSRLLSGSLDKSVRLWELATSKELSVLIGHEAPLSGVAFMKEENYATSIDADGELKIWNLDSNSIEKSFKLHTGVTSSSFHPQRPLIAIATKESGASIWDLHKGKQLASVPASSDVEKVTFSPDGLRLATVGSEPTLHVWLTEDLLRGTQATPEVKLVGHSGTISSVSFSPDGKRLISCGQDESVRLFDLIGGRELIRFNSVHGNDGQVRFSPDGKSIFRTIGGDFHTWKSVIANHTASEASTKASMVSWHRSEAAAAEKSQNWFAAHFHQDHLVQLEPENIAHLLKRANLRLLLGDWAGAEKDLRDCEGKIEKSDNLSFLTQLARAYLGQQKWNEYDEVCIRLLQEYGDSTSPAELNACLWSCALSSRSKFNTSDTAQAFKKLLQNPRFREIKNLNTLALVYYRNGEYVEAIRGAQASAKKAAVNTTRLPVESMILALAYAQKDQQRIGWLPQYIRQIIRRLGFSSAWNSSLNSLASVDAWMLENDETMAANLSPNSDAAMLYRFDVPQLRKEWDEIANARSRP